MASWQDQNRWMNESFIKSLQLKGEAEQRGIDSLMQGAGMLTGTVNQFLGQKYAQDFEKEKTGYFEDLVTSAGPSRAETEAGKNLTAGAGFKPSDTVQPTKTERVFQPGWGTQADIYKMREGQDLLNSAESTQFKNWFKGIYGRDPGSDDYWAAYEWKHGERAKFRDEEKEPKISGWNDLVVAGNEMIMAESRDVPMKEIAEGIYGPDKTMASKEKWKKAVMDTVAGQDRFREWMNRSEWKGNKGIAGLSAYLDDVWDEKVASKMVDKDTLLREEVSRRASNLVNMYSKQSADSNKSQVLERRLREEGLNLGHLNEALLRGGPATEWLVGLKDWAVGSDPEMAKMNLQKIAEIMREVYGLPSSEGINLKKILERPSKKKSGPVDYSKGLPQ